MKHARPRLPVRCAPSGFTLVEASIATLLVGGLLVVAMNLVGASRATQAAYADRERAVLLADDLLQEVLAKPYQDPDGVVALGIEVGETLALRASFDDTDDYDGHTESPPTDADGRSIAGAERFTRTASVQWADPASPDNTTSSESGLKRVTVTVDLGAARVAEVVGYQSIDWPAVDEMEEVSP
ncbi:MAG: hypothetical protein AAFX76_09125 [Planctomycetota bacterium]